jgi:hypothetical protein
MVKINEEFIKKLLATGKKEEDVINFIVANKELINDKITLIKDLINKVEILLGEETGKEAGINASISIINKEIKGELSNLVKLLEEERGSEVGTETSSQTVVPETVTPPSSETAPKTNIEPPELKPEQVVDQVK